MGDEACANSTSGLSIWGSPLSHGTSQNNAFQSGCEERLRMMPLGIDILVTHGPLPDVVLKELRPRLHVSGHIHGRYGARIYGETVCVNASIMDGRYKPTHGAVVVDMH